jgi:hypothetical protein
VIGAVLVEDPIDDAAVGIEDGLQATEDQGEHRYRFSGKGSVL